VVLFYTCLLSLVKKGGDVNDKSFWQEQ
jgi:hypothetical protein